MVKVVPFKIEEDLLKKLDKFAEEHGMSRSDVIREAIKLYVYLNKKTLAITPKRIVLYS